MSSGLFTSIPAVTMSTNFTSILVGVHSTFIWVPDNSDRDKSARKRGLVGPYVKTTRTV